MDAKDALYRVIDINNTSIAALERLNEAESMAVAGVLKETFKYTDALLEAMDKMEVDL